MSVEHNLPIIRERKQAILTGDPDRIAEQKKAGKLTARERINALLDSASFVELDALACDAGVVTGYGLIEGSPVYVYAQDFTVKGGAVGAAHARKVKKVLSLAEKTGAPVIAIYDTAGARLDEGVDAISAYAEMASATSALSGVVPQVALVMGQCGGIAAACAEMNDFVIMSKAGALFVNGPQVVSAVSGKAVTMDAIGGPDACVKSGVAQITCASDEEAIASARKLVSLLPVNNMETAEFDVTDDVNRVSPDLNEIDTVADARDVIARVVDNGDYVELGADFAASMVTAIAKIGGRTVGIIANQPSKDEGRLTVYGCKKAARLVTFCDAFSIPVVSLVDSNGMKINSAPQGELARAGAQLLFALSEATTPRVAVITGNAVGMGYAALASRAASDMVYAWPGAVVSAVTAPIAVQLTMADQFAGADDPIARRAELEEKYKNDVADGVHAAVKGYVDDVIEPSETRQLVAAALEMLAGKRDSKPAKKHGNMPL